MNDVNLCHVCGERPATLCDECQEYVADTTDLAYAEAFDNVRAEYESAIVTLLDAAAGVEDQLENLFGPLAHDLTRPLAAAIRRGIAALPAGSTWIRPDNGDRP